MKKRLLATIPVLLVVFLCSFNVFANDHADSYEIETINALTTDGKVRYQINTSVLHETRETAMSASSGTYISYNTEVLMTIILTNQSSTEDVYCNNLWGFTISVDSKNNLGTSGGVTYYSPYKITDIAPLSDDNFIVCNLVGEDASPYTFNMFPNPIFTSPLANSRVVVPAGSSIVAQFTYKVSGYSGTGVPAGTDQFYVPTVISTNLNTSSWTSGSYPIKAPYYSLYSINLKMDDLIQGYSQNVTQSQTVTNESSSLETTSDNVHTQESSYYTQTNTALSNTGLSNFSFSPNVIGGLGKAKDQFTYVWNKLGDYKDVYLFSMTLAIALMIIRHVRPIRRKKEE